MEDISNREVTCELLIIGAGIAGLAAADHLIQAGIDDILIVEATERIGGRIRSIPHGDGFIELGAQFVHGQEGNPIYHLAEKHAQVTPKSTPEKECLAVDNYWEGENDLLFTEDGVKISSNLVEKTKAIMHSVMKSMSDLPPGGHKYVSIGEFYREKFSEHVTQLNLDKEEISLMYGIYRWLRCIENVDSGCDTIDHLLLDGYNAYEQCPGKPFNQVKPSFSYVLTSFLTTIPREKIVFEEPVTRIQHHNEAVHGKYVTVECKSGTVLHANHVIITIPLGVLKAEAENLFDPPLPKYKIDVIKRLGFGTISKIFLQFDKPFWDADIHGYEFIHTEDTEQILLTRAMCDVWHNAIVGFGTLSEHPNLLEGFIFGSASTYMEALDDDVIIDACVKLLKSFLDKVDVPRPIKVIRTTWKTNPYYQGTYSHISVHGTKDDPSLLAKPIPDERNPRLMFAGEATHPSYYSTTHGALLSGQREATRLIKWLTKL